MRLNMMTSGAARETVIVRRNNLMESFDQNPQNPLIESFLESTMVNDIGMWRKSYDFNDVAVKHACFHFQLWIFWWKHFRSPYLWLKGLQWVENEKVL